MKFEIGLSIRAYAKRRGVSDKAVRKAIASGRIAAAMLPDKTIDPALADGLWEANTDPSQRRGKEALRAEASMAALAAAQAGGFERAGEPDEDARSPIEDRDADDEAPIGDPDEDEDDEGEEDDRPRPVPLRPEDFEEDPPRRRGALSDEEMAAADALAAHVAANRGRAASGQPRPSDGGAIGEDAEALLALAVEERREKVRKLRLANDKEEKKLIDAARAEAHAFTFVRSISEAWQMWPDAFAPDLAAKHGIDGRELLQDLRDGVREQLGRMAGVEAMRLDA